MAVYVLTIDGVPKALRAGTPDIKEVADGINTMSFECVSLTGTDRIENGEEVILTEDGITIFGGTIDGPAESYVIEGHPGIVNKCQAVDFNEYIDRRVLNLDLPAGTLEDFLIAIEPYLTDFGVTLDPSQPTGPSLPALSFPFWSLRDAVTQVIELSNGWLIEITYDKVLRGYQSSSESAPVSITTANRKAIGDIEVATAPIEANFVYVLGGEGQLAVDDAFTGDGVTTDFDLNYTLVAHAGYVTVNGVNETLDAVGGGATWEYATVGGVTTISRTSAPANGHAIAITYTGQFPKLVTADTAPAPADLKERIYRYPDVFDVLILQALADALVARTSVERKTVRYRTAEVGLHPGQTQTITVAARDLSGTFLITDVQVTQNTELMRLERIVTAVSGTVYPGSPMDDVASWGASSSTSSPGGIVTVISSGGVGGSGTPGTLAQWLASNTLTNATAVPATLLTGTIAAARLPQFTGGDVVTSGPGSVALAIQNGAIFDNLVNASAAIAWTKISKTGSSLADLTTRSASDLSSGNLAYARMPSGSGTWTATPTINGNLTMAGHVGTSSYVSQATGWRITTAGEADFRYLFVDEMHAKSFIADLEQALAGGQIIAKSVAMVSQPFTAPAAGNDATLWVRDLPSAANMAAFESGDYVVLRAFTRSAGALTIADCVGVVTSYVDGSGGNDGQQQWTFSRSGSPGTMTAGTVVPVDAIVIDYGVSGNGYYEVNAIDGAYGVNSPYAQVVTWTSVPIAANRTVRARFGNLKGITSVSEYGFFAGDFANNSFVRFSDQAAQIRGIPVELYDGATNTVRMNPAVPSFAMGSTLPSAYGTGTGIWMGKDSSVYKFRVGNPAGDRMTWDNTTLNVVGTLTATSGTIGSFTIGATTLTATGVTLDGAGIINVGGSGSDALWISTSGGAPHRIWIGDSTASVNLWYVNGGGNMFSRDGIDIGLGPGSTSGGLTFAEMTYTPTALSSGTGCRVYHKADKFIVQYNLGGTLQYFYLDLTSGSGTWSFSTSAP